MKIQNLIIAAIVAFAAASCEAYTCNYQELNKPNTKKSTPGDTWEACLASGKKNGPQSNLVIWLADDSANFIRGQFVNGPITGEWHEINKGDEQKFLGTASAAGKAASSKKETGAETGSAPAKPAKAKAAEAAAPEEQKATEKPTKEKAAQAPAAGASKRGKKSKEAASDQSESDGSSQKKEHGRKSDHERKHKKAADEEVQS